MLCFVGGGGRGLGPWGGWGAREGGREKGEAGGQAGARAAEGGEVEKAPRSLRGRAGGVAYP